MASGMRLIDAHDLWSDIMMLPHNGDMISSEEVEQAIMDAPTVDAVEVEDKELLKEIKILAEQYGHSKQSDYVHRPVAHALYHTWKKLDGERKDK